jgi:hypothetical protein
MLNAYGDLEVALESPTEDEGEGAEALSEAPDG